MKIPYVTIGQDLQRLFTGALRSLSHISGVLISKPIFFIQRTVSDLYFIFYFEGSINFGARTKQEDLHVTYESNSIKQENFHIVSIEGTKPVETLVSEAALGAPYSEFLIPLAYFTSYWLNIQRTHG